MYLKSIEVHGFKSFANKLVFEFEKGITGIVGPNGSGKSNVADAVRWVLGEQSARQLRGASMQDVIFSGTEMRKPQSYAYVALTITNEDHKLNVPYEEVEIARRVYRSGESEYLLNGTACRLKDVQEMFFDTGIGKEGYSIIGQGQVDKILNGKPEERRELFDEAAGIVKFKKRKNKAEKDLEVVRQNLESVNAALAELERQVGPLERQSEKAREYLKLKQELKNLEINMFLVDYETFNDELKEAKTNLENTQKELDEAKEKHENIKNEYSEIEERVEKYNQDLEEDKTKVNEDRLLLSKYENEINMAKQNIQAIAQGKEFYIERIEALEKSMADTKKEMEEYQETQREALNQLKAMEQDQKDKEESLLKASERIAVIENDMADKNDAVYDYLDKINEINVEQQKYESMLEQNSIKKSELSKRIFENKSVVEDADSKRKNEEEALEEVREKLKEAHTQKSNMLTTIRDNVEREEKLEGIIREKQGVYHRENSRLESLKNIAERYEGYGQSIRRIMEQKKTNHGIIGVVADIIRVEKKYEVAVETSLGGTIQNIVTEDEETAKKMIDFLKKNRFGRATFLPLTTVTPKKDNIDEDVFSEKGVLGRMSDMVECDSKFDELMQYLLNRYILVDQIDNAIALEKKYRYKLRVVTLEGELMNPGGSISGGAFKNNNKLLSRGSEMEELEKKIASLKSELQDNRQELEQLKNSMKSVREEISKKDEEINNWSLEENTARIKYDQAVKIKEEKELEYNLIANDGKELENQRSLLEDTLTRIKKKLEETKEESQGNKDGIETLAKELDSMRGEERNRQEEVSKAVLDIAAFNQKNEYIIENLNRLESAYKEYEEEHFSYVEDGGRSDDQVKELEHSIEEADKNIASTNREILDLEQKIKDGTENRDAMMSQQKEFFERRDFLMQHIGDLDKESFRLDERLKKLNEQMDRQVDYMWNEYEITYIGAKEYKTEESLSYLKMKSMVSEIKGNIRTLGDVNVNAIEDYKNVSERYETQRYQRDDLVESGDALRKIIEDLDEGMRTQFTEKFEEIKVQFNKVFKDMFGGGKGELELAIDEEDEDTDVLNAGVRIIAQPPGKKLKNMMQLSGGERALTAIALLFAIQNLKPSPFCLLDEIEAALDDSNVKRYAKYLHKLTKRTQFIVITHKQGTMEEADTLYGITMQEKGISTLVSVKLVEDILNK